MLAFVAVASAFIAPTHHSAAPAHAAVRASAPLLVLDSLRPEESNKLAAAVDGKGGETAADESSSDALWPWQLALMGITACWGANFAVTTYALDALGGSPQEGELFIASRFLVAAGLLLPFLASASSAGAVVAGAQVGGLCALGYATQAVALGMGTNAGTAAFICSLQSVVVALMAARASGVAPRTWLAVALSVAGVGCLELPGVLGDAALSPCLGDLVAFGQPLGFGLSYVVLEKAMAEYPQDELPLAAPPPPAHEPPPMWHACAAADHDLPHEHFAMQHAQQQHAAMLYHQHALYYQHALSALPPPPPPPPPMPPPSPPRERPLREEACSRALTQEHDAVGYMMAVPHARELLGLS